VPDQPLEQQSAHIGVIVTMASQRVGIALQCPQ
jgi:hypothetical protein